MLLKNKNAVIYGGGGAIGGAVARVFAREGATVFIAGRTQAKLDAVARAIAAESGLIETARVDVLDERAVEKHAGAVAATAGGIDIALNAVSFMDRVRGARLLLQERPLAGMRSRPERGAFQENGFGGIPGGDRRPGFEPHVDRGDRALRPERDAGRDDRLGA